MLNEPDFMNIFNYQKPAQIKNTSNRLGAGLAREIETHKEFEYESNHIRIFLHDHAALYYVPLNNFWKDKACMHIAYCKKIYTIGW